MSWLDEIILDVDLFNTNESEFDGEDVQQFYADLFAAYLDDSQSDPCRSYIGYGQSSSALISHQSLAAAAVLFLGALGIILS